MTPRILVETAPGESRVAVAVGGALLDFALWRPGAPDGVGDLHRGRVLARVPAMAGTFVAIGGAEGFLPDSDVPGPLAAVSAGTMLGVRVSRAAQGGKGPRLTARLTETEAALATAAAGPEQCLLAGPDPLERLAAAWPDAPVLVDEPALLATLRGTLGARARLARPAFDDAIAGAVASLAEPTAVLPGGAIAHIHPTPALVAIDIDSGRASAAGAGKGVAQAALNRALLPALARQIRLRNLSGAILIDFAGMAAKRRASLGPVLAAALADDPLRPRLLGFTALGLAEILRPRVHPPLHELMTGPHAAGLAALRAAAAEPGRLALRAAPAVISALQADPFALPDLTRRTGASLVVRSDPTLAATAWQLERP